MNQELDQKLVEKYPKIFTNRHESMTGTAMCWGFCCGDGWYNIIDTLCHEIQKYVDRNQDVEQVVAAQVKEKFGTLRFYIDGGDDTVYELIDFAESLSEKTCEVCGSPGVPRGGGWIKTLCDQHAEGRLPLRGR